ncbi:MAG: ISNCY family transposase [Gemmatimonadetes bacterium]|nr:ISNCY family transposase [Gemmatimonadota bacterium]
MSRKEFERGAVFGRVDRGELALRDAVALLKISYRQSKRLYKRFRTEGPAGLVHRSVGRVSNHAHASAEREGILDLIREHYGGKPERGAGQRFGPTLVAEHLREDHGIRVSCSTLRDWMIEAGLWSRVRRSRPKTKRRERREHFGELVQLDGSFHDWFEGRGDRGGRRSCVMNMVDDATSTTLLRFGEQETIWAAVDVLRAWIERYGVPRALYTDWKNVYKRRPTAAEEAAGEAGHTHFGRMCAKLGIEIIAAGTPQAKGRVERSNGTQQDRLIKKMRLRGIADDAAANAYVESVYLPAFNARYAVLPASPVDYHLPRDPALTDEDVFCLEHPRKVGNDFVVQFGKRGLQLDRGARGRVPAGSRVIVRETQNGDLRVMHVSRVHGEQECRWTPAAPRTSKQELAPVPPKPEEPRKPHSPAPDHPWRRSAIGRRAAGV